MHFVAAAQDHTRVSGERGGGPAIVSGLYETLPSFEGKPVHRLDDKARSGRSRSRARTSWPWPLDRFCLRPGAVAGDLAVPRPERRGDRRWRSGLALEADHLLQSGFGQRFVAGRGRFQGLMSSGAFR